MFGFGQKEECLECDVTVRGGCICGQRFRKVETSRVIGISKAVSWFVFGFWAALYLSQRIG